MAHASTINSLTDGLIHALTGVTPDVGDDRRLKTSKDSALRTFKSLHFPRVNQFDIQARLDGLEEKFSVLNRDDLADALHASRQELASRFTKWTPEILSLLMSLSDRPAEKTDLATLRVDESNIHTTAPLTWADILAEDPLTEEGIWDDVVLGSDISDDQYDQVSDKSAADDHTISTQASSVADDDIAAIARSFIVKDDDDEALASLDRIHGQLVQSGLHGVESGVAITDELYVIREALFMLRGLPTRLFVLGHGSTVKPRPLLRSSVCEPSTFAPVMQHFAELGTHVLRLRDWSRASLTGCVLQRLDADVRSSLSSFDNALMEMELSFLRAGSAVVVSMLQALTDVQDLANLLIQLSKAIFAVDAAAESWTVLDSLFNVACDLQLVDDSKTFSHISKIFFNCLEVFLRPVHLWVTQGKLQSRDDSFFVHCGNDSLDRNSMWRSRYELLRADHGDVRAPSFMHKAVHQIFISGKSTMFLNFILADQSSTHKAVPPLHSLDADAIIANLQDSLLPFASVLEIELQKWVGALQTHSMLELRQILHSQCGLQDMINVIGNIFLSMDGERFQNFAHEIFQRMDRNQPWTDRFIITDLAHATLGKTRNVDTAMLSMRVMRRTSGEEQAVPSLEALDRIMLDYSMSWPLRNIISNLDTCRRAWLLSLRIYRAEYVLTQQQKTLTDMRRIRGVAADQVFALRQRLIWFTNVYRSHIAEVNASSLESLRRTMDKAMEVDGMVSAYTDFQQGLETKLLLGKNLRPIYHAFIDLLDVVEEFAQLCKHLLKHPENMAQESSDLSAMHAKEVSPMDATDSPRISRDLRSLTRNFETQLHFVISGLNAASRLGEPSWKHLAQRLQSGAENVVRD